MTLREKFEAAAKAAEAFGINPRDFRAYFMMLDIEEQIRDHDDCDQADCSQHDFGGMVQSWFETAYDWARDDAQDAIRAANELKDEIDEVSDTKECTAAFYAEQAAQRLYDLCECLPESHRKLWKKLMGQAKKLSILSEEVKK